MLAKEAAETVARLDIAAFMPGQHQDIAQAIGRLHANGKPTDPVSVHSELPPNTVGFGDLVELQTSTPSTTSASHYADTVNKCYLARQHIAYGLEIAETGYLGGDPSELVARLADIGAGTVFENTWAEIDLEPVVVADERAAPPEILHRDDGQALIYPGKIHAFNADSESGKSWLALWACVEEIQHGRHVLYIDFEDSAESVVERLEDLGAPLGHLYGPGRLFHYVRPDDRHTPAAIAKLAELGARLVVLDGVTEAMSLAGLSIKENDDIAVFLAALPRVFARSGSAVILIDHVVKKKEDRGDNAIGGIHKRAGIDGASYMLDRIRPFGRGLDGAAMIYVTKDRPGHIRPACVAGRTAGQVKLTSTGGHLALTIAAPESIITDEGVFRPTVLMEKISREIEDANHGGVEPPQRAVLGLVKGKNIHKTQALQRLVAEGFVEVRKDGKTNRHVSVRPFRDRDQAAPGDTRTDTEIEESASWDPF